MRNSCMVCGTQETGKKAILQPVCHFPPPLSSCFHPLQMRKKAILQHLPNSFPCLAAFLKRPCPAERIRILPLI